jgi:hypothetical protein
MNLILPSKLPHLGLFAIYQREISHCEIGSDFKGIKKKKVLLSKISQLKLNTKN